MRAFCDFCNKSVRILHFLRHNCAYIVISHSSFSVAAVATHEQFKELNLQHSREVFIYFGKTQTLICIIQYIQRDIYFNKITNFGFFCSSFSNFFCWVLISSVLTTILKASRQKWSILPRRGSNSCSWFEGRPWEIEIWTTNLVCSWKPLQLLSYGKSTCTEVTGWPQIRMQEEQIFNEDITEGEVARQILQSQPS